MKKQIIALKKFLGKYPVIVSALIISVYYFATTLNFFQRSDGTDMGLTDLIFQYDSLIFLWIIAYIFIRSENLKRENLLDKQSIRSYLTEAEKSKIASGVVSGVIRQLEDRINNPLTVISAYTDEIRNKLFGDNEIEKKLDQIDLLLQRIHTSIKDVSAYQTQSILDDIQIKLQTQHDRGNSVLN